MNFNPERTAVDIEWLGGAAKTFNHVPYQIRLGGRTFYAKKNKMFLQRQFGLARTLKMDHE